MKREHASAIRSWWPFALLCVVASCEWLATDRWPQAGSTLASEATGCALAAVFAGAVAFRGCRGKLISPIAFFAGMLVLAGPLIGMFVDASMLAPSSLLFALALTPVVIAVAETAIPNADGQQSSNVASSLWPGLAAAAGLMLLLPMPSLANPRNVVVLVLAPLLTGLGCVLFRRSFAGDENQRSGWQVPTALAGAALIFALGAGVNAATSHAFVAPVPSAVAIDLLLAMLAVLALRRLSATRYAARFVLVPLLLMLEGFISFHVAPSWRVIVSAVLLTAASWALLNEEVSANEDLLPRITG